MSLCLFRLFWSESHPKSDSSFSMLHNLVATVAIGAASMFLDSTDALSHTVSHYSNSGRTKDMYICSNDLQQTLNFRERSK